VSALFAELGFSLEGGALIAGVALSTLPSRHEIGARLAPLRDFFVVAFFILLGTRMVVSNYNEILIPAAILSVFVLIGNPLLQLIVMGSMGYRRKTSFQSGMMAAQISEFSLILVALGVSLGQVAPSVLSTVTLVGIVTIFISSYLILYSDKIYSYVAPFLKIFERKKVREKSPRTTRNSAVIIGGGRIGYDFIKIFEKEERQFLVVDHDPEIIENLVREGIPYEYGDANDPDLLDELKIHDVDLVISTVPDFATNLIILSCAKRGGKGPAVIMVSHRIHNALELYQAGADYVVLPHFLGGTYAASLVKKYVKDVVNLQEIRDKHIAHLRDRAQKGHEHPHIERFR
jgi:voltage-gated potassium channel Kch